MSTPRKAPASRINPVLAAELARLLAGEGADCGPSAKPVKPAVDPHAALISRYHRLTAERQEIRAKIARTTDHRDLTSVESELDRVRKAIRSAVEAGPDGRDSVLATSAGTATLEVVPILNPAVERVTVVVTRSGK